MRSSIAVALAGLSSLETTAALAQTADPAPQAVAQGQLADIMVTAQRREGSLQKVPVAVTAIGRSNAGSCASPRAIVIWRPTNRMTAYGKVSTSNVTRGILSGIPYKADTLTAATNAGGPTVSNLG